MSQHPLQPPLSHGTNSQACPCCGSPVSIDIVLVDEGRGIVSYRGRSVFLTVREMRLFNALRYAYPKPLDKDRLFDWIYAGYNEVDLPQIKIVDIWVCKARAKLDRIGILIDTTWGFGYGLILAEPGAARSLLEENIRNREHRFGPWDETLDRRVFELLKQQYGVLQIAAQLRRPYRQVQRAIDRVSREATRSVA